MNEAVRQRPLVEIVGVTIEESGTATPMTVDGTSPDVMTSVTVQGIGQETAGAI